MAGFQWLEKRGAEDMGASRERRALALRHATAAACCQRVVLSMPDAHLLHFWVLPPLAIPVAAGIGSQNTAVGTLQ